MSSASRRRSGGVASGRCALLTPPLDMPHLWETRRRRHDWLNRRSTVHQLVLLASHLRQHLVRGLYRFVGLAEAESHQAVPKAPRPRSLRKERAGGDGDEPVFNGQPAAEGPVVRHDRHRWRARLEVLVGYLSRRHGRVAFEGVCGSR